METTHKPSFNLTSSLKRMDEILDAKNKNFEESTSIPSRDRLTYSNGFYVYCSALFVDIRDSSTMTDEHKRPVLAKIYRSFISEMVALFNDSDIAKEVNIHGDCVWCVCDTPLKTNIDKLFSLAAKACSIVDILNYKLEKKGYTTYSVGIGLDYGRALMIKAGNDGSGINDVVWMGDVVNQACHLSNEANSGYSDMRVFLSNTIYNNLSERNQKLCTKDAGRNIYQANVVNIELNNWLEQERNK